MSKKGKSNLPPHITAGTVKRNGIEKRDTFGIITESLVLSDAFQDLKSHEKLLFCYMTVSIHGHRQPAQDATEENPLSSIMKRETTFYFPLKTACEYSKRYQSSHERLYQDIKALAEHGFIKIRSSGKHGKTKSIYEFSEEWKHWKAPENIPP